MKKLLIAFTALFAAFTLAACSTSSAVSNKNSTIKVGVAGSEEAEIWSNIIERGKKDGLKIKLVHFTDGNQINAATQNGQVDVNAFQHYYYLNQWNKSNHGTLKAVGKTYLAPTRLYPGKGITKVSDLKSGDQIVIPNDPTNEGRALALLQTIGLIKLKHADLATPNDITNNRLNLKIIPVDAGQLPQQLKTVAAAVIDNGTAHDSKLNPHSAIFVEPISSASSVWINILAANANKATDPNVKKLIKLYQTQTTKDLFKKYYPTEIPAWDTKF